MIAKQPRKQSPSFFRRDPDGSARLRLRIRPELASKIEEAAGREPLMSWLYRTLEEAAERGSAASRRSRVQPPPPPGVDINTGG